MNIDPKSIPGLIDFAFNVSHDETKSNRRCKQVCEWIKKYDKKPLRHSKDTIERRLGNWLTGKRQSKSGKGNYVFYQSDLDIAISYGLPDLFELIDFETKSNDACRDVCEWMKEHNKTPSKQSKNPIERRHCNWLNTKRQAKSGKKIGTIFYQSDLDIAISYGLPDLFELNDLEKKSNDACRDACEWIKKHNKIPSSMSENTIERRHGAWLNAKRQSKSGKGSHVFYQSDLDIAKSYGLPDLFVLIDFETKSNDACREVCEWTKKHNKTPSKQSKNPIERRHCNWLNTKRQAKSGKGPLIFYQSDLDIAISYGLPDLFELNDLEKKSNDKCRDACEWIKKHNKIPNDKSQDTIERKYGKWLNGKRQSKSGKGSHVFYQSDLDIAISYGLPDLFEQIDFETKSNDACREVCEWTKKHGKIPNDKSKDTIERKCGKWLTGKRSAKSGKGSYVFYQSDLDIAISYGLPDLFELNDLEKKSNDKCRDACEWIKKHNKIPSSRSKNAIERRYGRWLISKRSAKSDKGPHVFYHSDLEIAKSSGLPDLFEPKRR